MKVLESLKSPTCPTPHSPVAWGCYASIGWAWVTRSSPGVGVEHPYMERKAEGVSVQVSQGLLLEKGTRGQGSQPRTSHTSREKGMRCSPMSAVWISWLPLPLPPSAFYFLAHVSLPGHGSKSSCFHGNTHLPFRCQRSSSWQRRQPWTSTGCGTATGQPPGGGPSCSSCCLRWRSSTPCTSTP